MTGQVTQITQKSEDVWLEQSERRHSVVMLQLPDLSLVAVNFPLQTFNLLFVVVNFLLVMLLQSSQLFLLLTPFVIRCTGENKAYTERKRGGTRKKKHQS